MVSYRLRNQSFNAMFPNIAFIFKVVRLVSLDHLRVRFRTGISALQNRFYLKSILNDKFTDKHLYCITCGMILLT